MEIETILVDFITLHAYIWAVFNSTLHVVLHKMQVVFHEKMLSQQNG